MDENVLKMVASIKGKSGKKSDEMLVDLLSKMSEAYSESKNENKELNKVILELKEKMDIMEAENNLKMHANVDFSCNFFKDIMGEKFPLSYLYLQGGHVVSLHL